MRISFLKKEALLKIWTVILWLVLIFASQHLVRDILSDIFGIRNGFTEFLHRGSANAVWCGPYCKWITFPVEIFYIIVSIYLLKNLQFGWPGWVMVVLIIPILLQYFDVVIK